tara:strand:+ start:770 stop:1009 length:240 start_codon:yes stop_codon:yes gene_type:complete
MHFYVCPYCVPSKKSNLEKVEEDSTHEECIEVKVKTPDGEQERCVECVDLDEYRCKACGESFIGNEKFLKDQKRKIKDG